MYSAENLQKNFFHYTVRGELYEVVKAWFESKNLFLADFNIIVTPPGGSLHHHIDYKRKNTDFPKVNWVFGGGQVSWYKTFREDENTYQKSTTDIGAPYFKVNALDCVQIDKNNHEGCMLINSGIVHSVENFDSQYRYCFSALPAHRRKTLTWEEACEIFV